MADYRLSLTNGSEEVIETTCDICSKDGRNTEASSYYAECHGNLCLDCSKWHDKFPATKGHSVVNVGAMYVNVPLGQGQSSEVVMPPLPRRTRSQNAKPPPLPPPRTDYQHLRNIESKSLPGNMKPNVEFEVLEKLERLKGSRHEQLKQVDVEETEQLNSVQHLRDRLMKRVEDLSVAELENITKVHEADRKALKDEIKEIDEHINRTQTGKTRNAQLDRELIGRLARNERGDKTFTIDTEVEKYLGQVMNLGKFASLHTGRAPGPLTGCTLEFLCDYEIAFPDDKVVCNAYGTCLLADGTVVLADNENKRLKFLDRKNGACFHYALHCGPWAVCSTSLYEVAVTLTNEKRVQFVSVGKSIGMTRSFGVEQFCRGIWHNRGDLYVTCGSLNQSGSAFVGVYSLTGQPLRKIQNGPNGLPLFSIPHHVVTSECGSRICVADKTEGVVIIGSNGRISRISDKNLAKAFGICMLDNGDILACGLNSDTVVQFSKDGRMLKTLLGPADGLYGPYSLTVDQAKSTLLMTTYESNKVKEYALK